MYDINCQSIDRLDINQNNIELLKSQNLNTIWELVKCNKVDLENIGLLDKEMEQLETELQMLGLNLKNEL